ncbi:MAG: hypothetical protein PHW02_01020 [bacterium]|nr:hypothetical protein [bacterium]
MKRFIVVLSVAVLLLVFAGCTDTKLTTDIQTLKDQIVKMEETVKTLQADVEALKNPVKVDVKVDGGDKVNTTNEPVKSAPPKTK